MIGGDVSRKTVVCILQNPYVLYPEIWELWHGKNMNAPFPLLMKDMQFIIIPLLITIL